MHATRQLCCKGGCLGLQQTAGNAWPFCPCTQDDTTNGVSIKSCRSRQLTWVLCTAHSSSCALCLDVPTGAGQPGGPEGLVGHGAPREEQHGHPRHAQGCTAAVWGAGQLLLQSCGPARLPHLHTVWRHWAASWALPHLRCQNRALLGYIACTHREVSPVQPVQSCTMEAGACCSARLPLPAPRWRALHDGSTLASHSR